MQTHTPTSALQGRSRTSRRFERLVRARKRRLSAGFTLVELMVVVVLVAILALIAAPQMRVSRDDRLAFDYARQIQQMIARARTRAAGRGGAHLIIAGPSGTRGKVQLWEALDGVAGPVPPGPNPTGNCKTAGQFAGISAYVPGVTALANNTRIIEGIDLDTLGVNVDADIKATFRISDPTAAIPVPPLPISAPMAALAMCVTASGTVYAGQGAGIDAAIADMQANAPFTGVAQITITRNSGGVPVGLARDVFVAGASAPRIYSR